MSNIKTPKVEISWADLDIVFESCTIAQGYWQSRVRQIQQCENDYAIEVELPQALERVEQFRSLIPRLRVELYRLQDAMEEGPEEEAN